MLVGFWKDSIAAYMITKVISCPSGQERCCPPVTWHMGRRSFLYTLTHHDAFLDGLMEVYTILIFQKVITDGIWELQGMQVFVSLQTQNLVDDTTCWEIGK